MTSARFQTGWPFAGGALLLLLVLAALGYRDTFLHVISAWNQWQSGEYYAHGYLIGLLSVFLVWRERGRLLALPPCPQPRALAALAACSLLWAVASVTGVQLVQAAVLVPLVLSITWSILGLPVTRILFVPVFVLVFAMPVWEVLTPLLQDFTADIVYAMTRLAGIPALREDYLIVLPSGQLAIEESCSGMSYLLAALTLGMIYGYLYYHHASARVVIVLISGAAAIVANILRVFIVVIVAYRTEMHHPIIYQHFGLGWYLFGGLVMVLLVLDNLLQRRRAPAYASIANEDTLISSCRYNMLQRAAMYSIAALLVVAGPLLSWQANNSQAPADEAAIQLPDGINGWYGPASTNDRWAPVFHGANESMRVYDDGKAQVFVYLGIYARQRQGRELIFDLNRISDDRYWQHANMSPRIIEHDGNEVIEKQLVSTDGQQRLVWYWYRVAGRHTTGRLMAKVLQALGLVTDNQQAAVIAVAADVAGDEDKTRATLQQFLAAMGAALSSAGDSSPTVKYKDGQ